MKARLLQTIGISSSSCIDHLQVEEGVDRHITEGKRERGREGID